VFSIPELPPELRQVKTLNEQILLKGGKEWWLENGTRVDMTFLIRTQTVPR
jgi:hypothetical protein